MLDRKVFTLRTSENLINKIAVMAEISKRSINAQMEYMLELSIKEYEEANGPIVLSNDK